MLNLMWSQESELRIKEEQDVSSDQDSPRILEPLRQITGGGGDDDSGYFPHHTHPGLNYGVTVTLTQSESSGGGYDYLLPGGGDSGALEASLQPLPSSTLQPLPSFHCLPTSPSKKQFEYIPVSLTEFINNTGNSSPDSSSSSTTPPQALPANTSRRKRTNSGSSGGSSGTSSSTSRQMKRRRPPISQEELMVQRNQGD